MMKLLAIDATEAACSAALLDGEHTLERCITTARQHNEHLLPMLQDLLSEASLSLSQLDGIAFACGPGSFTGVRIATAVAQGIALASDLPVVSVSSLRALAQGTARQQQAHQVLAGFDARMNEVYWGAYQLNAKGMMQIQGIESLSSPNTLTIPSLIKGSDLFFSQSDNFKNWHGAGSAWASYSNILQSQLDPYVCAIHPSAIVQAQDVAYLAAADLTDGRYITAEQAAPVYLRNQVAKKSTCE
jgi:tRNA threonylcarbamoyladenosine biosynthesis protein TsaB